MSDDNNDDSRRMYPGTTPKHETFEVHAEENDDFNTPEKKPKRTAQNMPNKIVITNSRKIKKLSKETQQKIQMEKKLKEKADLLEYEVKMNKRLDANINKLQEKIIGLSNEQREMARDFNEMQQQVKKKIADTIYSSSNDSSDSSSDEENNKIFPKKEQVKGKSTETGNPAHQHIGGAQRGRSRSRSPLSRRTKDFKRDLSTSSEDKEFVSEYSPVEMNDKYDAESVAHSRAKPLSPVQTDRTPAPVKKKLCGAPQVTIERIVLSLRETQQAAFARGGKSILIVSDIFTDVTFTNASSVIMQKFPTLDKMRHGFRKRPLEHYNLIVIQVGNADIGGKPQKVFDGYYDLVTLFREKCNDAYLIVCSILPTPQQKAFVEDCKAYNVMLKEYYKRRSFSDFYNSWGKVCHANSVSPGFIRDGKLTVDGVKVWARGLSDKIRTIPEPF